MAEDDGVSGDGDCYGTNNNKKEVVYAIMGGTGMQGGAAIAFLLKHKVRPSCIRTLTRSPNSAVARRLVDLGVTVMEGSHEPASWKRLFENNNNDVTMCVFALTYTDFNDPQNGELEKGKQLWNVICETPSIQSVVFSGGERTHVPGLDTKADIEAYAAKMVFGGRKDMFVTFLHTSFFLENVLIKGHHKRFHRQDDGSYILSLPLPVNRKIAMISARDIGHIAGHLLLSSLSKNGETQQQKQQQISSIPIVGDLVSPHYFLEILRDVFPQCSNFSYQPTEFEQLQKAMGEAQAQFVWKIYDLYYQQASDEVATMERIKHTRDLYPETMDTRAWISQHAKQVLLLQDS